MKKHILALVLTVVCISLYAVNPIKEGNMISGHVIVKGTEENIPYATILLKKTAMEQSQMRRPVRISQASCRKIYASCISRRL